VKGASIQVRGLRVVAGPIGAQRVLVDDIDFEIQPGEMLALVGESGSGKTTTALAMLGFARPGCRISGGHVTIGPYDVMKLDEAGLRSLRGRVVTYVAQSAAAAFDPSRRLLDQVIEPAIIHEVCSQEHAKAKAVTLMRELSLPDPENIGRKFPHQVSGGQLQRIMAAMALITDPQLVVFDEPTTALDVTTQIDVLLAFKRVLKQLKTAAVYVTHDLAVVAQMADRTLVLRGGALQEVAPTAQLLQTPQHPYSRQLITAARRSLHAAPSDLPVADPLPLLKVSNLWADYGASRDIGASVLKDVSLELRRGQALGVVGESGSGKTTLAKVLAGLHVPSRGQVEFQGRDLPASLDTRSSDQLRRLQIVFQSADTALNPRHSVRQILERPLVLYHGLRGQALTHRVRELLDMVQLASDVADRLPREISGGQKQRVNLARALAAEPDVIICDEVTSALDTVVGTAVLELLAQLRRDLGVALLFISHDMECVKALCDDIVVMYAGRVVQTVPKAAFEVPSGHPYYELLSQSVPPLRVGWLDSLARDTLGVIESRRNKRLNATANAQGLCDFRDRCPHRQVELCDQHPPSQISMGHGIQAKCHFRAEQRQSDKRQ
jgi:peptide/nickel transport system ATP-binding protein